MVGRVARVLALSGVVIALVVSQGAPLASGEESDGPTGYTIGTELENGVDGLGDCAFYKLDLERAEITQVSDPSAPVLCGDGLTFDDDGTLYAYRNQSTGGVVVAELVTIDLGDGTQHLVGALPPVPVGGGGMTFDEDGHLWLYGFGLDDPTCAASGSQYCLWKVNPENAHSAFVGAAPVDRAVFGLAGDCEDVIAITTTAAEGPVSPPVRLDDVNTSNASLDKIADLPGVAFPTGLDFDDEGGLWAIGSTPLRGAGLGSTVYEIDPDRGTSGAEDVTLEGGGAFNNVELFGLAVSSISCEEPAPPVPPTPAPLVVAPIFTG